MHASWRRPVTIGVPLLASLLLLAGTAPQVSTSGSARISARAEKTPVTPRETPPLDVPVVTTPPDELGGPTTGATFVPVLMYHWIRVNPDPNDRAGFILSVTPSDFTMQMLYLKTQGFNVVSLHTAVKAIQTHRALPAHPVVLTFDDAYRDFYTTAAPVLTQLGFTATEFVPTAFVGRQHYLTWDMIRTLDAEGFTIGDHTVHHVSLGSLSAAQAYWEMSQAKQELETVLNHPILDFAYPSGSFNQSVMRQAKALGFEVAVSTMGGVYHTEASLMALTRQRVSGGISMSFFAQQVVGPPPTVAWIHWAQGQVAAVGSGPAPRLIHPWDL